MSTWVVNFNSTWSIEPTPMTGIAAQISLSPFGGDNLRVDTFLDLEESVYENHVQVGERLYVCYFERRVFFAAFCLCIANGVNGVFVWSLFL